MCKIQYLSSKILVFQYISMRFQIFDRILAPYRTNYEIRGEKILLAENVLLLEKFQENNVEHFRLSLLVFPIILHLKQRHAGTYIFLRVRFLTIVNPTHNYANLKFYVVRIKFNLDFKNNVNKTNERAHANRRKFFIFSDVHSVHFNILVGLLLLSLTRSPGFGFLLIPHCVNSNSFEIELKILSFVI